MGDGFSRGPLPWMGRGDEIEERHEYLGSTKGTCKLCLRAEDHPIHEQPEPSPNCEGKDDA